MHQKDAHPKLWLLSASCIMGSFQCDMSGKARSTSPLCCTLDYEMRIKKRKKRYNLMEVVDFHAVICGA